MLLQLHWHLMYTNWWQSYILVGVRVKKSHASFIRFVAGINRENLQNTRELMITWVTVGSVSWFRFNFSTFLPQSLFFSTFLPQSLFLLNCNKQSQFHGKKFPNQLISMHVIRTGPFAWGHLILPPNHLAWHSTGPVHHSNFTASTFSPEVQIWLKIDTSGENADGSIVRIFTPPFYLHLLDI